MDEDSINCFHLYHLPKLKMLTTLHALLILFLLTEDEVGQVYLQWLYWSSFLSCNWIFPLQASCHWLLLAETDTDPGMPRRKPRFRIQLWTTQWTGIFMPTELSFIILSDGLFYVTSKRVLYKYRFVQWEGRYYVIKTSKSNKIYILFKLIIDIRNYIKYFCQAGPGYWIQKGWVTCIAAELTPSILSTTTFPQTGTWTPVTVDFHQWGTENTSQKGWQAYQWNCTPPNLDSAPYDQSPSPQPPSYSPDPWLSAPTNSRRLQPDRPRPHQPEQVSDTPSSRTEPHSILSTLTLSQPKVIPACHPSSSTILIPLVPHPHSQWASATKGQNTSARTGEWPA